MKKVITIALMLTGCLIFNHHAYADKQTAKTNETAKQRSHTTMKFNHFAYLFLGPALDPTVHHTTIKTDAFTFTTVGISFDHKEQVIEAAKAAVANGAQMIELCGGFGPLWVAKVYDALDGKIPVGSVAYGPEARKPILDLLS